MSRGSNRGHYEPCLLLVSESEVVKSINRYTAKPKTVLEEVVEERQKQDAKWGGTPGVDRVDTNYTEVLGEEFGEVCKAKLERNEAAIREELIQVAAVAIAEIEQMDNLRKRQNDYS